MAMALTNEEKGLIEEALSLYLQVVSQQLPQHQVQQVAVMAQGLINKLDYVGAGAVPGADANRPGGISDEWFEKVCKSCDKLTPGGCEDKVTLKFPGKCDPILHYERGRLAVGRG
jgi:hypothetical protein